MDDIKNTSGDKSQLIKDVIELSVLGYNNQDIAEILNITPVAVGIIKINNEQALNVRRLTYNGKRLDGTSPPKKER